VSKKKRRPKAGDYCRNKHSGTIHKVTKISPAVGWFQLDDQPGWSHWQSFKPVPEDVALEELKNNG